MLTLPSRTEHRPAAGPAPVRVSIRRRRSVAVLAMTSAALVLAAVMTGSLAVWAAAAAAVVLTGTYLVLLARVRRLATEREMALAFGGDVPVDWAAFEREMAAESRRSFGADAEGPVAAIDAASLRLGRFVASYVLGWVLTPVVALVRLAGGDTSDIARHHVVERLVRAQEVGRAQSLRLLAAGVVATAGVSAVAGMGAGVASASPAVAASATGSTYTVRSGDTLGSIAARFGTTVSAIASANGISDPNLIFPGQVLTIPGGSGGSEASSTGTYVVQAGDTLGSIAARFGTTVADLASLNHLGNPNLIYVGERLAVNGSAPAASSGSSGAASSSGTYVVQAGDTLGSIATRFGTTVANLAALNHLSNPNLIYVGEVLTVSGTASTAPASGSGGGSPSQGSTSAAAVAVKVALEQVGKPYVWGGAGPNDFDCSGLVMYAWAAAGVDLPHYTVSQYDDTRRISESQLEPGDLVFYNNYDGPQPGHVAMYIGGGQVVSANEPGTDVQTQSISYDGTIWGFGRVQ